MKKIIAMMLAAVLLLTMALVFAEDAYYSKTLSGGIKNKQQTRYVTKDVSGAAQNDVTYLSRTLTKDDPVVTKVRRGSDGDPVTSAKNVTATTTYSMAYGKNKGKLNKQYYMKMQNTTGSPDVGIKGTFTP